jgi:zinc/manganese transport system substrate-binding protein
LEVAEGWSAVLQRVFPAQASGIAQRHAEFASRWRSRIDAWQTRAAPLRGQRVAAQHSSHAYLWRWLGITQVADLEPKPGMAPTPGHLQRLQSSLAGTALGAVVVSSYQDPRSAQWLQSRLSASRALPLVVLPATVADPLAPDALGTWMDQTLSALLQAMPAPASR